MSGQPDDSQPTAPPESQATAPRESKGTEAETTAPESGNGAKEPSKETEIAKHDLVAHLNRYSKIQLCVPSWSDKIVEYGTECTQLVNINGEELFAVHDRMQKSVTSTHFELYKRIKSADEKATMTMKSPKLDARTTISLGSKNIGECDPVFTISDSGGKATMTMKSPKLDA